MHDWTRYSQVMSTIIPWMHACCQQDTTTMSIDFHCWPLADFKEISNDKVGFSDWGISCEIALRWISLDCADDKSTLVQVRVWCRQATNHYLSQHWPRYVSPYGVNRPQWVNLGFGGVGSVIMVWHRSKPDGPCSNWVELRRLISYNIRLDFLIHTLFCVAYDETANYSSVMCIKVHWSPEYYIYSCMSLICMLYIPSPCVLLHGMSYAKHFNLVGTWSVIVRLHLLF